MDILELRRYSRTGGLDISCDRPAAERGRWARDVFVEFFINDVPLSRLLEDFYGQKECILDNWIGVLGSFGDAEAEKLIIKQLLGKEAAAPELIIYCCGECGQPDCGGIKVRIDRNGGSVFWTVTDERGDLRFAFDKHQYFDVFDTYLRSLHAK